MPETNSIMVMIAAFIGVAIMIGLGPQILGNSVMNCSTLPGYNSTTPSASTGWAGTCEDANTSTQNAYALLIIVMIVIAAAAILFVVRLL